MTITDQKIRISKRGGLRRAEYLLRLRVRSEPGDPPLDVVFISIDLERGIIDNQSTKAPWVKEVGIAKLDTRQLDPTALEHYATKLISTQQFSTSHSSADFKDCDFTDFRECLFSETYFVSQGNIAPTITQSLNIQDNNSQNPPCLRNIVLVGHSIKRDLKVLLRLGVDFYKIAPIVAIFDTHGMSQELLGPKSCSLNGAAPLNAPTLGNVLQELKCPFKPWELHNAGNDAPYTLHAMLMLAIRSSDGKEQSAVETANLKHLCLIVQTELNSVTARLPRPNFRPMKPTEVTRETISGPWSY